MKIIQFQILKNTDTRDRSNDVYGLGDDGVVYEWDFIKIKWVRSSYFGNEIESFNQSNI